MSEEKRRPVQVPIATKMTKLKLWRDNPGWSSREAAKELDVAKGTLLGWKKSLWSLLDDNDAAESMGTRYRTKGGGRKKKLKSFELRVLEFYDSCHADGGTCTREELLKYAKNNIPEFAIMKEGSQGSWITRFIQEYKSTPAGHAREVQSAVQDSQVAAGSPGVAATSTQVAPQTSKVATSSPQVAPISPNVAESAAACAGSAGSYPSIDLSEAEREEPNCADDVAKSAPRKTVDRHKKLRHKRPSEVSSRLRKRKPLSKFLMVVTHQLGDTLIVIHLQKEDFDSLLPAQWLSTRVVDSIIYKYMLRAETMVYPLGTSFYMEIENAYRLDQGGEPIPEEVTGGVDWGAHRYLLLPIAAAGHYSFAVIEKPLQPTETICYHIDSLRGVHDAASIFETLKWFLAREWKKRFARNPGSDAQAFAYLTKPRQSNSSDCGVYMLHYMHKVIRYISEKKPNSIAEKMDFLTSGSFNVNKAAQSRTAFLQRLENERLEVQVIDD